MSGIEATWVSADGSQRWEGWLPHLDLAVARELTSGSEEHAELWQKMTTAGVLSLRGYFDLKEMLQPAIQPGAKLDYERPSERVTIQVTSSQPFRYPSNLNPLMQLPGRNATYSDWSTESKYQRSHETKANAWVPLIFDLPTPFTAKIAATWHTADDPRPRAFPVRRFVMPWAHQTNEFDLQLTNSNNIPEGGNWLNGRRLYTGKALCARCHTIHGQGGRVGPDLSNLAYAITRASNATSANRAPR